MLGVATEAVAAGDLELGFGMTLRTLFGLHALTSGIFERMGSLPAPSGVGDPERCCAGPAAVCSTGWAGDRSPANGTIEATMARIYDEILTPRLLALLRLHEDPDARRLRSTSAVG